MTANEHAVVAASTLTNDSAVQEHVENVLQLFLDSHTESTRSAYRRDVQRFARFVGVDNPDEATNLLLAGGHANANTTTLKWRNAMLAEGLAPNSINRALAAVRSLVKLGRMLGMIGWTIDVPSVRRAIRRDTRGPGLAKVKAMVAVLRALPDSPKSRRDMALFRLMCDVGLRRGEVASLDVGHVDLEAGTVLVLGKGSNGFRAPVTLPRLTKAALVRWLEVRDTDKSAPLFVALHAGYKGRRLSAVSIWRTIKRLGEAAGAGRVWPHGLRHASITTALDRTNGDIRAVKQFSRHADVTTVLVYDDARVDGGARVADLVSSTIG